jgi:hypothetical protein
MNRSNGLPQAVKTGRLPVVIALMGAFLQISVSASAEPDIEPPTVEITAVDITKLDGDKNVYRFVYTIVASDNVGVEDLEIHGAVGGGAFDEWKPGYAIFADQPLEIILICFEFRFEVRAKDAAGNFSLPAGHYFKAEPKITGAGPTKGKVGKEFSCGIKATAADRFACSKLPKGLKFNQMTGRISGTPKKAGRFKVKISAINSTGTNELTVILNISD